VCRRRFLRRNTSGTRVRRALTLSRDVEFGDSDCSKGAEGSIKGVKAVAAVYENLAAVGHATHELCVGIFSIQALTPSSNLIRQARVP
jgi:hypothetical protein